MKEHVKTPCDRELDNLCARLADAADPLDLSRQWPAEQLQSLADYGVYRWFLPLEWGGYDWDAQDVVLGHIRLASACLTTTFILTQRTGACRRILASDNLEIKQRLLPLLAAGDMFATIGISHLTTSRRHLGKPVLTAEPVAGGFLLDGYSPWITGASHADWLVVGADASDGSGQLLVAIPTAAESVACDPPADLTGLSASHTGAVRFDRAFVNSEWVLEGPQPDLLASGGRAGTGGIQTSALAAGLALAAIEWLTEQAKARPELSDAAGELRAEFETLRDELCRFAVGDVSVGSEALRKRSNDLALRATQATMMAAKGAGYIAGHCAGRWCREALFFLVWSCPRPVVDAHLCALAGIEPRK